MKPFLTLIILSLCIRSESRADIKFVDFKKIDPAGQYSSKQQFLLENLVYFDHWSPDWVYQVPKESLIDELKTCLSLYGSLKGNAYETDLLLGELAHYLYNLSEQKYYDTAEAWYRKAIALDEKDCRGYWFLGYHYATSDEVVKGVTLFSQALKRVDNETGKDFWQEYAFTMMLGGLTSHSRYGLDTYLHLGGTSVLSKIMDSTLRSKTLQADADISYSVKALWETEKRKQKIVFTSRPLGLKFEADSNWQMQLNPYGKHLTAVSITPPIAVSSRGARIGYTVAIVAHAAGESEKLEDFIASMMKGKGIKDPVFPFANRFSSGISYTIDNKSVYSDRGGARIHFMGIERDEPQYPGLALEDQAEEINGTSGKLEFRTLGVVRNRFHGRIFYLLVLDTCEDIHAESWKAFQGLVDSMKLD